MPLHVTLLGLGHMNLVIPTPRNAMDGVLENFRGGRSPTTACSCANSKPCEMGVRADGGRGQPCLWWSQGCSIGCEYCATDPRHPRNRGRIPTQPIQGFGYMRHRWRTRTRPRTGCDAGILFRRLASRGQGWLPDSVLRRARHARSAARVLDDERGCDRGRRQRLVPLQPVAGARHRSRGRPVRTGGRQVRADAGGGRQRLLRDQLFEDGRPRLRGAAADARPAPSLGSRLRGGGGVGDAVQPRRRVPIPPLPRRRRAD
mmetsp:Transcript_41788/g.135106  ORF Transcript_41788/g.135106 Transcript_41788/m.135106 type:complete len:259 (+) Transcript_41788:109-885(+)